MQSKSKPLVAGEDFYYDGQKRFVFTKTYLLARGFCCKNGCRHCPYPQKRLPDPVE